MNQPNLNSILSANRQSAWHRCVSFVLALLLFVSYVPFPALSVESGEQGNGSGATTGSAERIFDYDTMYITLEGEEISSLSLYEYEKIEIAASGLTGDADYQWQVQHPENDDVWVNIYDGTKQDISVTAALVGNVLREDGTAKLRCRAYTEDYAYLTSPITVTLLPQETAAMPAMYASAVNNGGILLAADETENPEFVTVTIEYILYQYVEVNGTFVEQEIGNAFTSYVATLQHGTPLDTSVHSPTLVGFEPTLTRFTIGGEEQSLDGVYDDKENLVKINFEKVTSNVVYRVEYHPAEVNYQVRYFFQNIYDDLYVEDSTIQASVSATGKTGTKPDLAYVQAVIPGFTSLYYEPETIAADGSTMFHVYYERNYYLMEFDCNEGYGTDTIYVRYGTYISVPNPVRSGWVFAGWDLVATDDDDSVIDLGQDADGDGRKDGDGNADTLPSTMPRYNSAYKALWTEAETSYSVVYWILDDNGHKTFIGSRTEDCMSNKSVNGQDDLSTAVICGKQEHNHSDSCYSCGGSTHDTHHAAHTIDCYSHGDAGGASDLDVAAIKELENGKPESGYIYVINAEAANGDTNDWPKLYFDDGDGIVEKSDFYTGYMDQIDGDALEEKLASNKYKVTKYKAKTTCGKEICQASCGQDIHTHSGACGQDTRNLVFVRADQGVTIEGDGSSIVNVYYEYQEYTLKFYYAATTGGTDSDGDGINDKDFDTIKVVGGSTYYFGRKGDNSSDDETLLENEYWSHPDEWGAVDELPTLNAEGVSRNYTKGSVTYDYTDSTTSKTTSVTYHYISFKARYNDDISDMWPCAVFNSVTRTDKSNINGWSGIEAFVSAWNGEHHVKYSGNSNQTIKGVYEKLDDMLLFDSSFLDETEVSYLCFWENGANVRWSVPELYRYNIWLEGKAPNGEPTVTRDGLTFYLADTYDTCDNSSIGEQTQPGLTGYTQHLVSAQDTDAYEYSTFEYKELTGSTDSTQIASGEYFDSSLYAEGYEVNFYYTANRHSLKFYNFNGWLGDGQGAGNSQAGEGVSYGTPLQVFGSYVNEAYMKAHYPDGLEPGAYYFAGWYTTALCLPGTEVNWDTMTMPDADLTVYAYWKPKERDIYFYLTYNDMISHEADPDGDYTWDATTADGTKVEYPIVVEHGTILGTTYNFIPQRWEDANGNGVLDEGEKEYTFVGWFYIDENGKKRFAPDSMEVKDDLHLFAEWQSGIDTQYNVSYVLKEDATIGNQTFPAGTDIADKTTGHLTAGKTKTFTAKVGTDLSPAFQDASLFPTVNSHSILMEQETENNQFTFEYVYDNEVYYRVRYVDKITGLDLLDEKVDKSTKAIVTEKFVPIAKYIPENYYIRKVLAADGNSDGSSISELNEIIFYYTPDTTHGLYTIEYYTQNLDGSWPEFPQQSFIGSDDLLDSSDNYTTIAAPNEPNKFNGFEISHYTITTYKKVIGEDGSITYTPEETDEIAYNSSAIPSGQLTEGGLEIRVYYTRKSYDYIIQFVEWGTENNVLGYGQLKEDGTIKFNTDGTPVFDSDGEAKALFESTISYTAPGSIEKTLDEGGTVKYLFYATSEKPQSQTHTIRSNDAENVLTFYYQAKTVSVFYEAVCFTNGATDYGAVSLNHESAATASGLSGSTAMPGSGFVFKGWYSDPACTSPVGNELMFKPTTLSTDVDEVRYYALFEPIFSSITISKNVNIKTNDSFLFRIQGTGKTSYIDLTVSIQGNGSVLIAQLPVGDYIITELTNWSWEYQVAGDPERTVTVSESQTNTVTFENSDSPSDWLNGEAYLENIFTGVSGAAP